MAGVPCDGLLKIVHCAVERFPIALHPEITSFDVELVGLRVHRMGCGKAGVFFGGELHLNRLRDSTGYVILEGNHIAQVALVGLGPEVPFRRSLHQIGSDAQAVAGPHHGAFHQGVHLQLVRDFGEWLAGGHSR